MKSSNTALTAFIFTLLFLSLPAQSESATPQQQLAGLVREPLRLQVTLSNGQQAILDAFVTRPAGKTALPVALITQGSSGNAKFDRDVMNPNYLSSTALAFAQHGYAAVAVMREGYGDSSGAAEYSGGSCAQPHHALAGKRDTMDVLAALAAVRKQPWASADTAILAGMSAGGFAVLAAGAVNPPGVKAVINFAGGRGAIDGKRLCDEAGLLAAFSAFGNAAKVPSLWLYAANDNDFSPAMAQAFYTAYTAHHAPARFSALPAFGKNGHVVMDTAPSAFWWPPVGAFLKENGLPYREQIALPDSPLTAPVELNNAGGKKAFAAYQGARRYEKAFAIGEDGSWGAAYWARTADAAAAKALSNCNHHQAGQTGCRIYALGDEPVSSGG
ncbi:dienelactone hydrolase [Pantoea eucrina]|uniref:Dienelactone hydrolase n=1 Tax=Pantoea eucrina TaxID=472693 RepID=A0ABU5LKM6_9GAMM|nr:CocE/NonD family hydrolase [Pantoea eucrina]MDZ7280281.1 dienelactone hydrolase [Pantoea eucrina]